MAAITDVRKGLGSEIFARLKSADPMTCLVIITKEKPFSLVFKDGEQRDLAAAALLAVLQPVAGSSAPVSSSSSSTAALPSEIFGKEFDEFKPRKFQQNTSMNISADMLAEIRRLMTTRGHSKTTIDAFLTYYYPNLSSDISTPRKYGSKFSDSRFESFRALVRKGVDEAGLRAAMHAEGVDEALVREFLERTFPAQV